MRSPLATLIVACLAVFSLSGTSASDGTLDPDPLQTCLLDMNAHDDSLGAPDQYPGARCVISQTPVTPLRTLFSAELGDPFVVASVGAVNLRFSDGTSQTVVSVGVGEENPQCSAWSRVPFVAGCSDNPVVPDQYLKPSGVDTSPVQCLWLAHLGVDANRDGNNETFVPSSTLKVLPGACTNGEFDL